MNLLFTVRVWKNGHNKVHLQLLSTDESKPREARVARQTTKNGLYNALDIGSIWLQKANENG